MASTKTELARAQLGEGLYLVQNRIHYTYGPNQEHNHTYERHDVLAGDNLELVTLADLSLLAKVLKSLPEGGALDLDYEDLKEFVREAASELAEELEVPFIYIDEDGDRQEYTPKSLWEPSGGCEWEESASEYDYGWNI